MGATDEERVSRYFRGDPAGMASLYAGHAPRIRAYFRRRGFAEARAADLTHEVFCRVLRSLGTFDPERGSFAQWISAIARNAARKAWRRRADADGFDPALAEQVLVTDEPPDRVAERRERLDALDDCVRRLPPDLARIVRLRYVEGRTTRGIAAVERVAEATVRLRLDEARELLRRCMREKGVTG
jgi:RNA polymerase sigma-70 factor (ECF subfamily)